MNHTEESAESKSKCFSPEDLKSKFKMATKPFGVMSGEVKSFSNSLRSKHADIKEMRLKTKNVEDVALF